MTHIWLGRALITLGMINGGLGMLFSGGDPTRSEIIAYGVVAGGDMGWMDCRSRGCYPLDAARRDSWHNQ